jgi:hypothetical protein
VNECGKTTILQAILCFDESNDKENDGEHLLDIHNLYETDNSLPPKIAACITATPKELISILGTYFSSIKTEKDDELMTAILSFTLTATINNAFVEGV